MDAQRYIHVLASGAATLVVFTGLATAIGVARLDKATAKQCASADWPVKADDVHRDWCISNGYTIPPRGTY
jgi:hypothetical protein